MKSEQKPSAFPDQDLLVLRPSWRAYFVFYTAILVFGLGPTYNPDAGMDPRLGWGTALALGLYVWRHRSTTRYRLTRRMAIKETGLFGKVRQRDLPFSGIESLEVHRGLFHHFLGIGHLQIRSRTPEQPHLWWFGIKDPGTVKKQLQKMIGDG